MKYIYPAIFEKEENGQYSVSFPDFDNAFTCGDDINEAFFMAADCLGLVLLGLEEDHKEFPNPSKILNFKNSDERFISYVDIDFDAYKKNNIKNVKKSLLIPKDLNDEAEYLEINFSKVLREALRQEILNQRKTSI